MNHKVKCHDFQIYTGKSEIVSSFQSRFHGSKHHHHNYAIIIIIIIKHITTKSSSGFEGRATIFLVRIQNNRVKFFFSKKKKKKKKLHEKLLILISIQCQIPHFCSILLQSFFLFSYIDQIFQNKSAYIRLEKESDALTVLRESSNCSSPMGQRYITLLTSRSYLSHFHFHQI